MISVLSAKDVELLKSDKVGEKEPKGRPIYTLVGIVFLAIGYGIALRTNNSGAAINNFFPAALSVMVATYILFTAGSITLLKLLKKNKNYYYTTGHFISVSGLLYRMKQNAGGLATICILSTAAIVVLSAGASLYTNGEYSINEQFPRMIQLVTPSSERDTANALLQDALSESAMTAQNAVTCTYNQGQYVKTADGIAPLTNWFAANSGSISDMFTMVPDAFVITLDEYNRFNQTAETLSDTELLLYASDNFYTGNTLTFQEETYQIKGTADNSCLTYITDTSMSLFSKLLIVVPNDEVYRKFLGEETADSITYMGFDLDESSEDIIAFSHSLSEVFTANGLSFDLAVKQQEQEAFNSMYGGILFVGVILGVLFILSTVMIIYYKQISEGYEDKERFLIMQKVGLSKQEIKKSIHSQIMLVFFLPLVAAILHSAVALKIIASCLRMIVIVHMPTFIASVAVVCVLFAIVYMVVYKITSKEY